MKYIVKTEEVEIDAKNKSEAYRIFIEMVNAMCVDIEIKETT